MNKKLALLAVSLFSLSGTTQATLLGRDLNGSPDSFEAYYDTDLNITWLADANYGAGSIYDDIGFNGGTTTDGRMTWASANAWAANLSFTDGVKTYDNWRLPSTLEPDASCSESAFGLSSGYNCTGSEMGHLIYNELGSVAGGSVVGISGGWSPIRNANYFLFSNIQYNAYFSATEYTPDNEYAYYFDMRQNLQAFDGKLGSLYAWAVSPGDVAAVPEPGTYSMMLVGLGLLAFIANQRKRVVSEC